MKEKIAQLLEKLEEAAWGEHFVSIAYDAMDTIKESENAFLFVEPIIEFMENHPQADLGCPGPLAHFVEKFYRKGYEEILVRSLNKRPTQLTVFLLNRIINDMGNPDRESYIELMKRIACREDVESDAREAAVFFIEARK